MKISSVVYKHATSPIFLYTIVHRYAKATVFANCIHEFYFNDNFSKHTFVCVTSQVVTINYYLRMYMVKKINYFSSLYCYAKHF